MTCPSPPGAAAIGTRHHASFAEVTGAWVRAWLLVLGGVLVVGLVILGLRAIPVPAIPDDRMESARGAIDRMVEPDEEVIREDIGAYVAQQASMGDDDVQRPVGGAELVLSGSTRGHAWRLLAFRTPDTVCSLLVVGARDQVQHGCVAPSVIHPGQFIPQHADGLYAGIVDESVLGVRAVLMSGAVVAVDTVASRVTADGRLFALPLPAGAEAETFDLLDENGRVIDSFGNPYRP